MTNPKNKLAGTPERVLEIWERLLDAKLEQGRAAFLARSETHALRWYRVYTLETSAARVIKRHPEGFLLLAEWLREVERYEKARAEAAEARSAQLKREGDIADYWAKQAALRRRTTTKRKAMTKRKWTPPTKRTPKRTIKISAGTCDACGRPISVNGQCGCS